VCCLDFAGSGHSEGDWVSLGAREPEDVEVVVNFLRNAGIGLVGIWGRSMGAVTALRYCHTRSDHAIAGLVLDSPFRDLPGLIRDLARSKGIPTFAASIATSFMRRAILDKAGFDIMDCTALDAAQGLHVPALFVHGQQDELVGAEHSRELREAYAGDSRLLVVEGGHNDARPMEVFERIRRFFLTALQGGLKEPRAMFPSANPFVPPPPQETS